MTSPFETSGSTKEFTSADDLLRELCGDDEAEAIIRNETEELATAVAEAEASSEERSEKSMPETETSNTNNQQGNGVTAGNDTHILSGNESFDPFESTDEYLAAHRGQFFIFDIETFPDESRFPRPTVTSRERREWDLADLQTKNAEIIVKELKTGLMQEDQLAELLQLENTSKKPRSTVAKEIMKAIVAATAMRAVLLLLSVTVEERIEVPFFFTSMVTVLSPIAAAMLPALTAMMSPSP